MPLRRTYRERNTNNPKYNPITGRNIEHQAGQQPGDNVHVNSPIQDGDTNLFGNWSWESPNAVNALQKISAVTDIDDSQYYSVPNFRENHRSAYGAIAIGFGSAMSSGGSYSIFGGGFTQVANYINANSIDAGGAVTLVDPGTYMFELSGSVISSGGFITNLVAAMRIDATNAENGGTRIAAAAGAAIAQAPFCLKWIHGITANQVVRPAYFLNLSAGTAVLQTCFWKITPLYFI